LLDQQNARSLSDLWRHWGETISRIAIPLETLPLAYDAILSLPNLQSIRIFSQDAAGDELQAAATKLQQRLARDGREVKVWSGRTKHLF